MFPFMNSSSLLWNIISYTIIYCIILLIIVFIASKKGVQKKNILKPLLINYAVCVLLAFILEGIIFRLFFPNPDFQDFALIYRAIKEFYVPLSYIAEIIILIIMIGRVKKADSVYSNEELFNTNNYTEEK